MKPRIILDPVTVRRCLEHLTDAEAHEMDEFARDGERPYDEEAIARVSEWLLKRFPQLDASIRNSAAAGTN